MDNSGNYIPIRYKENQWKLVGYIRSYTLPSTRLLPKRYTRQINTLRAKYQVDQMEIANKEEHNRLITSMLAGSIMLLLMFTIIAFRLKKQQQR